MVDFGDEKSMWKWWLGKSRRSFRVRASFSFFPYTSRIGLRLGEKANGDFSPTQLDTFPPTRLCNYTAFFLFFYFRCTHTASALCRLIIMLRKILFSLRLENSCSALNWLLVFFSVEWVFMFQKAYRIIASRTKMLVMKPRSLCENENVARSSSGFVQNTVRNFPSEKIWSHRKMNVGVYLLGQHTRADHMNTMTTTTSSKKVAHSAHIKVYIMWRTRTFFSVIYEKLWTYSWLELQI